MVEPSSPPIVVDRRHGRAGELVLRLRGGDDWEVISNGTFLIAGSNEVSSRALVTAAVPELPDRPLDVLIGGLGLGYALDEALDLPRLRSVTVVELEDGRRRLVRAALRRARAGGRPPTSGRASSWATSSTCWPGQAGGSTWSPSTPTTVPTGWCATTTHVSTGPTACGESPGRFARVAWRSSGARVVLLGSRMLCAGCSPTCHPGGGGRHRRRARLRVHHGGLYPVTAAVVSGVHSGSRAEGGVRWD